MRVRRWGAAAAAVALLLAPSVPAAAGPSSANETDPLSAPGVLVDAAAPPPPVLTATSWIVVDITPGSATDGDVLAAQEARTPLAPASTIKTLTALALAPGLADDDTWTGTYDAAAVDGSKVGLVTGSTYTVSDLLHGLLLGSGNDCAVALADLSGGMPAAVDEMSGVAAALGATDTVVGGTSGLDAPGQVSSARDLALFGRALLADPRLAGIVATQRYAFPGGGTTFGPERGRFEVGNHNRLLGRYEGAIGVKNGYTDAARGSFVGAAQRDGRRYLVALLHAEGRTSDLAASLLDWAFAAPSGLTPVGSIDRPADASGSSPTARPDIGDGAAPVAAAQAARAEPAEQPTSDPGVSNATVVLLVVAVAGIAVALVRTRRRVTGRTRRRRRR